MREIRSKPGMPVWREDEDGRSMSFVITRAGRDAIGINEPNETYRPVSSKSSAAKRADRHLAAAAPRPGSKQALVIEMLSKDQGTTLDALVKATGWLPHTTRAALMGLRKRGFAVERMIQHDDCRGGIAGHRRPCGGRSDPRVLERDMLQPLVVKLGGEPRYRSPLAMERCFLARCSGSFHRAAAVFSTAWRS